MRASKLGCLVIFGLISSCSGAVDVPADTDDVGPRTRHAGPAMPAPGASSAGADERTAHESDSALPSAARDARFVGTAGSRFIVFDSAERTIVLDAQSEHAFGVHGHPVTEQADTFDPWSEASFTPTGISTRVVASDDGTTMLVQTEEGIRAVDLERRGALLTDWRGGAEAATISPDGAMFAARTGDRIHLVRTSDGARASHAIGSGEAEAPNIQWTPEAVYWADASGVRIVERRTFAGLHIPMANAGVNASEDGKTFVVSRQSDGSAPGVVEVWRLGDTEPRAHIVSAHVEQVTVDEEGSRVAWAESSGEWGSPTFLHTLDVATGVHARFSAHGHCTVGVEQIIRLESGVLTTDAECSPGCPSLPSQAQLIAYDFATGKKLREWSGERQTSFNDQLVAHVGKADELSARLGVSRDPQGVLPLIHSPADETVVVATSSGLRLLAETTGRVFATLASSNGLSAEDVRFTPDGKLIVGVGDDGRLAVWDATDGRHIWSWK